MQTLIDKFGTNATYLIAIAGAVILLVVLLLLARAVFGGRIRMSSGRARQPRLGVVDAFDLDRQRQLVLVRRDNVEHLVMIGGPNDLLIESTIIRTAAANEVRPRVTPTLEEPAAPAPTRPAAVTAVPAVTTPPPSIDELVQAVAQPAPHPVPAPAPMPAPPPASTRPVPVPPPPTRIEAAPMPIPRVVPKADVPPAPRPMPVPTPVAPLRPTPVPPAPPTAPARAEPGLAEPPKKRFDFGRLMASRGSEPARQTQEAATSAPIPPPVPPSATSGPAPAAANPTSAATTGTAEKSATVQSDPIDALEQEMAKLLGRSSQSNS